VLLDFAPERIAIGQGRRRGRWRWLCWRLPSNLGFRTSAPDTLLGDVELHPLFEAKCLESLERGDLLWVVGS
jgi:hypothetical protein